MNTSKKASVLVVCMGNICRSPTGEAVLRAKAQAAGMAVEIDSAGTIGYHQGNPPDSRARAVGEARGYSFQSIRARQVVPEDFERFDLILAADRQNLADLQAMCPDQYVSNWPCYLITQMLRKRKFPIRITVVRRGLSMCWIWLNKPQRAFWPV